MDVYPNESRNTVIVIRGNWRCPAALVGDVHNGRSACNRGGASREIDSILPWWFDAAMKETQLSWRGVLMTLLGMVIVIGGMIVGFGLAFPLIDGRTAGYWQTLIISGTITFLATGWFVALARGAARDKRLGREHVPIKVGGWFHVFFGAAVAAGGILCSVLAYRSAVAEGGGVWTFYWGMIGWGCVQMVLGVYQLRNGDFSAKVQSGGWIGKLLRMRR